MRTIRAIGLVVAFAACHAGASAQVVLGPLNRYIEAHASAFSGGAGPTIRHDGTGYGLFSDEVTVSDNDPGIATGTGLARQMSIIQPVGNELQFSITGRVYAFGQGPMSAGSGSGRSLAILDFTVTQPVPWRLMSQMTQSNNLAFQTATSYLERIAPAPAAIANHSYFFDGPQSSSGMLSAGLYRMTIDFNTSSPNEGSAELNFNILLAIPSAPVIGLPAMAMLLSARRRRS